MKISKKIITKAIGILIVLLIGYNIFSAAASRAEKFTVFNFWQNFPVLKQNYLDSQYVNKNPKGWIPDETVNAYAGAAYVQGVSPILIAPDTPPLGRYFIGVSALFFNNVNIVTLFFVVGSLLMMYLIGMQIFSKVLLALLAPLFLSFEPLFLNQIVYSPLLDMMQLFFLLCSFYIFNKALLNKKYTLQYFFFASFFLGCFIATKFYASGITVVAAWIGTLILLRRFQDIVRLLITLPIAVFVLLATYVRVLFDHYSLFQFLGIQKYIFLYHKSQLVHSFSVWDLLFFNKWHVSFGDIPILSDAQWRITWPLITTGSFITGLLMFSKKIKISLPVIPLIVWVTMYLLFLSIGESVARYFVILLPVLYIIVIYGMKEVVVNYILPNKKKRK